MQNISIPLSYNPQTGILSKAYDRRKSLRLPNDIRRIVGSWLCAEERNAVPPNLGRRDFIEREIPKMAEKIAAS